MGKECTRKGILKSIRKAVEKDLIFELNKEDAFIYEVYGGKIDALELMSIVTTVRSNLLSELMDKLTKKKSMKKEDIMDIIGNIILDFNN